MTLVGEPGTDHLEERLNMFCCSNHMWIVRLIYICYDHNRPPKFEKVIESVEEDAPRLVPPIYSVMLKMTNVCRIYLKDACKYNLFERGNDDPLNEGRIPTRFGD